VWALAERTEGWCAALQLVGIRLRQRGDVEPFLAAFGGTHRDIVDYLAGEVLRRVTPEVRVFLLRTSILEQFCSELAATLIGIDHAQMLLEEAEREGLFLVPLDEKRHWFRYHALFREFLRDQLSHALPVGELALLHLKAAGWFEAHGEYDAAISHALSADDPWRGASLLASHAEIVASKGEMVTLDRWLRALPPSFVQDHPQLALLAAMINISFGKLDEAERGLDAIGALLKVGTPFPHLGGGFAGTPGELAAGRSILAGFRGNIEESLRYTQEAIAQLPPESIFLRGAVAAGMAAGYFWNGDIDRAGEAFAEAAKLGERGMIPHIWLTSLCGLGIVRSMQSDLPGAMAIFQRAIRLSDAGGGHRLPGAIFAYPGMGAIHREWNELETAQEVLEQALEELPRFGDIGVLVLVMIQLARTRLAMGDAVGADQAISRADQEIHTQGVSQYLRTIDAFRAYLDLYHGRIAAAGRWADTMAPHYASEPIMYLNEIDRLVIARCWIAQGHGERAFAWLEPINRDAKARGRVATCIEGTIIAARALDLVGNHHAAEAALAEIITLTEPSSYLRLYLDEGQPIKDILVRLIDRNRQETAFPHTYARHIIAAFNGKSNATLLAQVGQSTGLSEPLNEREQEILQFLATGLSNQAMAEQMILAPSTVKWYLKHLFVKLGVHSRTQAIARGRTLGLLS
jgi:LuxR family maltose regulon positive regulatory protein